MSGCEDLRLDALLDGELGPPERAAAEAHVAGCADCAARREAALRTSDRLRRALGGLLLHVEIPRLVAARLPSPRRSIVAVRTLLVRRQLALAGFGVAVAFALWSFLSAGPRSTLALLSEPQRAALFLNWALTLAAGSVLVWPERFAGLESRFWAAIRGGRSRVTARDRLLAQTVGLAFLFASSALNYVLLRGM